MQPRLHSIKIKIIFREGLELLVPSKKERLTAWLQSGVLGYIRRRRECPYDLGDVISPVYFDPVVWSFSAVTPPG